MRKWVVVLLVLPGLLGLLIAPQALHAQNDKPFIFPVAAPPGPSTWTFGQPYGNTTGAFNFGTAWYSAGQGLHFGIDVSMPCGTPLIAMADGTVAFVDNMSFGSGPHNLLVRHEAAGLIVLYGHLLDRPAVTEGQLVTQGQIIAQSGTPDNTCDSRPHLHLEIRSLDYGTTYNPIDYINANWHSLAIVGSFNSTTFQGDMDNPRRWMALDDQPEVRFGGRRLNDYLAPWPPASDFRPAPAPQLPRTLAPLPQNIRWTLRPIAAAGCCWQHWWHPTDPDKFYVIDAPDGGRAAVWEWSAAAGSIVGRAGDAPPAYTSPDGTFEVANNFGQTAMRRVADNFVYAVFTGGQTPSVSTDNSRLLWITTSGASIPGSGRLPSSVWMADGDGNNGRLVVSDAGLSAQWLDAARMLVSFPGDNRVTRLMIYDSANGDFQNASFELGAWSWMRGLSVAPGGDRLTFYLTNQPDPADNGLYVIETQQGAIAKKVNWFGGWRWRDAETLYYIPLDADAAFHTLHYYNVVTGEDRILADPGTLPFTVMNGDWAVSADGSRILFTNAIDRRLTLLEYVE